MSWNYRVLVRFYDNEPYFGIHECHYSRKGAKIPHSWSVDPTRPAGDSLANLKDDLKRMTAACQKPTLVEYTRKDGRNGIKEWSAAAQKKAALNAAR